VAAAGTLVTWTALSLKTSRRRDQIGRPAALIPELGR
jgi:hypothetical protein